MSTNDEWTPPDGNTFSPDGSGTAQPMEEQAYNPTNDMVYVPGRSNEDTARVISHATAGTGLLPTWSASGLKDYETCPHRLRLSKVDKVEREEHPAAARGTAIHDIAECYVKGEWDAIDEASKPHIQTWEEKIYPRFGTKFDDLRDLFAEARVEVEGDWGFNKDWQITGWMADDVWARMKLDALEWESETSAKVIDYKTGRKFGNEIAHATQGMIYAVGTFMRYPSLEFVETNFWYLDHGEDSPQRYSREQAMMFLPRITDRATIMTSDTQLKPRPTAHNCKWCPYAQNETCDWRHSA